MPLGASERLQHSMWEKRTGPSGCGSATQADFLLAGCVTLGKSPNHSEPQFPHLLREDSSPTTQSLQHLQTSDKLVQAFLSAPLLRGLGLGLSYHCTNPRCSAIGSVWSVKLYEKLEHRVSFHVKGMHQVATD